MEGTIWRSYIRWSGIIWIHLSARRRAPGHGRIDSRVEIVSGLLSLQVGNALYKAEINRRGTHWFFATLGAIIPSF